MPAGKLAFRTFIPALAKANIGFGDVSVGLGEDATTALVADDKVFSLSSTAINEIAWVSEALKSAKNAYMNVDLVNKAALMPVATFKWRQTNFPPANAFTKPQDATYLGMSPRFDSGNFPHLNPDEVCNDTVGKLKLYPPVEMTFTKSESTETFTVGPNAPFTNAGNVTEAEGLMGGGGGLGCSSMDGSVATSNFYSNFRPLTAGYSANIEWSAEFKEVIPDGIWRVKYENTEIARFDLAMARPVDAEGHTRAYIPSAAVNTDESGNVTSVDVKFNYQAPQEKHLVPVLVEGMNKFRVTSSAFKSTWKAPGGTGGLPS